MIKNVNAIGFLNNLMGDNGNRGNKTNRTDKTDRTNRTREKEVNF